MSDQEDPLNNPDLRLRIKAEYGQWIPDNTAVEAHYPVDTVLPRKTWPSSARSLRAMIRAGDLGIEPDEGPPPTPAQMQAVGQTIVDGVIAGLEKAKTTAEIASPIDPLSITLNAPEGGGA